MQGGWARRQGQDLSAGGGGIGRRSRGVSRSISTTHGVVDKHANNHCPCPGRLAVATGRTACKDASNGAGNNNEDKEQRPVPRRR